MTIEIHNYMPIYRDRRDGRLYAEDSFATLDKALASIEDGDGIVLECLFDRDGMKVHPAFMVLRWKAEAVREAQEQHADEQRHKPSWVE